MLVDCNVADTVSFQKKRQSLIGPFSKPKRSWTLCFGGCFGYLCPGLKFPGNLLKTFPVRERACSLNNDVFEIYNFRDFSSAPWWSLMANTDSLVVFVLARRKIPEI